MEWIPVSERLPEDSEWVLLASADEGKIYTGYIDFVGQCTGAYYFVIHDAGPAGITTWRNVTHWMPLPELPKAD